MAKRNSSMEKCRVISVGSGKGGVGKTTVAYSFASLFSHANKKILLIDFDLFTQGLSHFFENLIDDNQDVPGILEAYTQGVTAKNIGNQVLDAGKFDVMFVSRDFMNNLDDIGEEEIKNIGEFLNNFIQIIKDKTLYDYVIIDNHAGACKTLEYALKASDDFLIISEANQISKNVTLDFHEYFKELMPRNNTYVIVNKVLTSEVDEYTKMVEVLDYINTLPPLPLDNEVMRAFILKNPIIDFHDPSPFLFAIFNISQRMFPHEDTIDILEKKIAKNILTPVSKQTYDVSTTIEEIDKEIYEIRYFYQDKIKKVDRRFMQILVTILYLGGVLYVTDILHDLVGFLVFLASVSVAVSIFLFYRADIYSKALSKRQENEKKEKELQDKRFRLQQELRSYESLLKYGDLIDWERPEIPSAENS